MWYLSDRADPIAVVIADRHYNRQKPGTAQFVPPGRCIVLVSSDCQALWVTSWQHPDYAKHAWAGAWINSLFRNEGTYLSSELIRDAVAVTRWFWDPPDLGLVTFVDAGKIRSTNPGYCYLRAGFRRVGYTKGGLVALQLLPADMPDPAPPARFQPPLFVLGAEQMALPEPLDTLSER